MIIFILVLLRKDLVADFNYLIIMKSDRLYRSLFLLFYSRMV